jgi:hypothetical protein
MRDPTGDGARGGPSPPVAGAITRVTWVPGIPGPRGTTGNRRPSNRRARGRPNSWRACTGRADSNRRFGFRSSRSDRLRSNRWLCAWPARSDRLGGHRWLGFRWLYAGTSWSDWLCGHRWFCAGPPPTLATSRPRRKLTGGWWSGTRAGQLRSARFEPVGHRGTCASTSRDSVLDFVAVNRRPSAAARR